MKPPSLPYGIGSLLKGNRFEILASILENGPSENLDHSSPEVSSLVSKNSVLDMPKIPDSNIDHTPPRNLHVQNCPAPKLNNIGDLSSSTSYTKKLRGRSKLNYFNKGVKSSQIFTKKLKESFSTVSNLSPQVRNKQHPIQNHSKQMAGNEHPTPVSITLKDPIHSHDNSDMEIDDPDRNPPFNDDQLPLYPEDQPQTQDDSSDDTMANNKDPMRDSDFSLTPDEEKALLEDLPSPTRPSPSRDSTSPRIIQPDIKRFFSMKNTANLPSVPTVSPDTATNVGTFTCVTPRKIPEMSPDFSSPPTINEQNIEFNKVPVQTVSKREVTCRFKIRITGGTCNLPLLVKQVVKLYRGVDTTLSILPIANPNDDALILDHEDSIPESEEELKQWVTSIISHHDRVHFTMRFSVTKTLSSISGPIFAWMKLN